MPDSEASAARVEELVQSLQARVEERRRSGTYPPGLARDLDAHYQRIVGARAAEPSIRERLDAVHETSDAFAADAIPLRSRIPGGAVFHRIVAKIVRRQTEGVIAQTHANARAVADALEALASAHPEARPAFEPWFEHDRFEATFRASHAELLKWSEDLAERLRGCDPVLDIGFGRGEFLELLGGLGVEARGVETDPSLVTHAAESGLDVALDDGSEYLRELADGSLGGITLIQVIEYLEPQTALDLVPLAARKVRPGGKVIVETANPESLYALARSFHVDPTQVRPVHPAYLVFLFREAGFAEVELVFAAQDYAVIATR